MAERKKILIVEDEAITAMELSDRMRKLGYIVVAVASSGEEAIKQSIELKPDVILMDIKLKGDMDGIEAAQRIHELSNTPVFYLTAYADESLLLRAKLTEPYAYMVKPFTIREIHSNIEVALYRYEIEEKLRESEERYRALFQNAQVGMFRARTGDGKVIECNETGAQILGYSSPDEVMAEYIASEHYVDPEVRKEMMDLLSKEGGFSSFQAQITQRDGTPIWVEFSATLYQDEGYLESVVVDITERKKTEDALRENEEQYRTLVDSLNDPVLVFDKDNRYSAIYTSDPTDLIKLPEDLLGRYVEDSLPQEPLALYLETSKKVRETGTSQSYDYSLEIHGVQRWFNSSLNLHQDGVSIVSVIREITERKLAQDLLEKSKERLRQTINLVPHQIFLRDGDGRFIIVNEATAQSYGITVDELQGKNLRNIHLKTEEVETFLEEDTKVLKTNRELHLPEQAFTQSDGTVRWVDTRKIPIQLEVEGACVLGVALDITERRRVQEALRVSEERFRNIFEESPLGIDVFDSQGDFIHANKACLDLFGISDTSQLREFNLFDDPTLSEEIKDRIRGGEIVRVETKFDFEEVKKLGLYQTSKSDVANHYAVYGPMGFDENEKPTSFIVQMLDITERKKAEEALAKHTHDLAERVKELTCLYETSRLIGSGQSMESIFEKLKDLMQVAWQYPDITCARVVYNGKAFATANFKETEWMLSADIMVYGEKIGVLEVFYLEEKPTIGEGPFFMEERNLINALAENVSRFIERIGAEDALEKSEAKYRALAEESLQGISVMQDGRVVYANQAYADISGRTIEELMAYTPEEIWQDIHPDDAEWLVEAYVGFLDGKITTPRSEFRIIHKDGTTRWVESYATTVEYEEEPALQIAQIDISERKRAEQNLEEALDNAEFFVDLMGHDLTNINQALSGTLELVLFDESLSTHTAETVNDALSQMKRATRLITNVKKFRNLDERASVLKPIDLERALLSAIQAVQEDVPEKKLEVRTNIDSRRFTVNADEHLNDILYSLLHNAAIHHPKEVVDVTVTVEVIDDSKNLRISVADDGNGVPDIQKELLFSRISKKKEGYWGTGIGLTLTKHIVDYYSGDIRVEDRVKGKHTEGASFVVILPGHMK